MSFSVANTVFFKTYSYFDVTSGNLDSEKVHEDCILQEEIYYIFSQETLKITNI